MKTCSKCGGQYMEGGQWTCECGYIKRCRYTISVILNKGKLDKIDQGTIQVLQEHIQEAKERIKERQKAKI